MDQVIVVRQSRLLDVPQMSGLKLDGGVEGNSEVEVFVERLRLGAVPSVAMPGRCPARTGRR